MRKAGNIFQQSGYTYKSSNEWTTIARIILPFLLFAFTRKKVGNAFSLDYVIRWVGVFVSMTKTPDSFGKSYSLILQIHFVTATSSNNQRNGFMIQMFQKRTYFFVKFSISNIHNNNSERNMKNTMNSTKRLG